jgi:peptide chain release factor 3
MSLKEEINRRRTFAIISHPDAGKTTLTEKLLLYGGAIHEAGAVKSNKIRKTATSDFMEIERQRGISVATSVMGFEYNDIKVNILDTPGHQDFAEDTYRTLTAVDSVIVVIDVAKGVEAQTEKLVSVCRMRNIPIMIFINKLDREGKDGFELLEEIEEKLGIIVSPLIWPIGMGNNFKGVYNLFEHQVKLFENSEKYNKTEAYALKDIQSEELDKLVGKNAARSFRDELELVKEIYPPFDPKDYLEAVVSPVFFGSALNNFGVEDMLNTFIKIAPSPRPGNTKEREVSPYEEKFSGFVFKIHANMDPKHRDRLAFVKIVSGTFLRNTNYLHVRQNKVFKFSSPTAFMASKKSIIDEAFPGDIVGLHDTGNFKIGDSLTEGEILNYTGIPSFSPELFRYVENGDPLKAKQLAKGVDQLMDEGVAQLFTRTANGRKIIGTVGALQFEVIEYRLLHEYGATVKYEPISLYKAAWLKGDAKQIAEIKLKKHNSMAVDKHGNDVFLAESNYELSLAQEKYPAIQFHFKSEF